ncbi:peptidase S8 [Niabella ginsenosidivorans]|uniref:Peptidase S8 n=1 Tax=Niabella ginsenosidivorans TaxID=1176587 RepID=A0A1A9I398_9BACT|nr:S8 family serine peptidase [Niabella ginsenosidivorans]ANH81161.1 peptidase S8 [Niabella ginsenosidivorans]
MKKLLKNAGLVTLALATALGGFAQSAGTIPEGWHLKDLKTDGYYGLSLDKAYEFLKSKNRQSTPVIVGIVDSGIDTTHEDLQSVLWINKEEIPGNGIDDDKDGYVDDVHGWNFLGSKDGKENVTKDSYEAARVYWGLKSKYENKTEEQVPAADKEEYRMWARAKAEVFKEDGAQDDLILRSMKLIRMGDETIRFDLKKEVYSCKDLVNYNPTTVNASNTRSFLLSVCSANDNNEITNRELLDQMDNDIEKINNRKQAPKNYRDSIVKDHYGDINDKYYGNNNLTVNADAPLHGTHVAGIIGAARNNGKGMNGVADNVQLMSVRAVPDGDEHDKDIALGIRFAVDHGARVINMSFGKSYSPEKRWVDDAVKYAVSKGVLLVHAAGNDSQNNDSTYNFPSAYYLDKTRPATWITVGASGPNEQSGIVASFSNYGKKEVDVFAPGVKIYSTLPLGNRYGNEQGTSMASPVVAGLAALIMSYYPDLTALQVKEIIEKSVVKPTEWVTNPGTGAKVHLSDLCVTGGIVNAYEAVKLADTYKAAGGSKTVPGKKARSKKHK